MNLNLDMPPTPRPTQKKSALWELGFRPFFIAAGLSATLLMVLWVFAYQGKASTPAYYGPIRWHAHEMLFGYTVAVIAGFLLTAVQNWTGKPTPTGSALIWLSGLWLAGRILPFIPGIPHLLSASIDMLFLPLLGISLLKVLWGTSRRMNLVFPAIIIAMTAANLSIHLEHLGLSTHSAQYGIKACTYLILLMIVIMGGRVIPFFIRNGTGGHETKTNRFIEMLAPLTLILYGLLDTFYYTGPAAYTVAFAAAAVHAIRLYGWCIRQAFTIALLWILLAAYAWLVIGFALLGLHHLGFLPPMLGFHALTAGCIGVMTLGMMARVALGHTGRPLKLKKISVAAFICINLAVGARVILPILSPSGYLHAIYTSAALWCVSLLLFTLSTIGVLYKPRADGKPG